MNGTLQCNGIEIDRAGDLETSVWSPMVSRGCRMRKATTQGSFLEELITPTAPSRCLLLPCRHLLPWSLPLKVSSSPLPKVPQTCSSPTSSPGAPLTSAAGCTSPTSPFASGIPTWWFSSASTALWSMQRSSSMRKGPRGSDSCRWVILAKLPMPELFSRAPLWREGGSMWILPLPRPFQGLFLLSTSSPRSRMLRGSEDWSKLKPGWLSCSWRWWPCRRTLHRLLSKCVAHEYILLKLLFTGSSQPCQPLLLVFLLWRLRQVVKFMRKFGLMPPMYPYKYFSTLYQTWLFCHLPSE